MKDEVIIPNHKTVGLVTYIDSHNLPEPVFDALINSQYVSEGDISVTSLIDAPMIRLLKGAYQHEIQADSLVPSMQGSIVHGVIERLGIGSEIPELLIKIDLLKKQLKYITDKFYNGSWVEANKNVIVLMIYNQKKAIESRISEITENSDFIAEERMLLNVMGWVLSGTPDLYQKSTETLFDFKNTGTYKIENALSMNKESDRFNPDNEKFFVGSYDWKLQLNIYAYMLRRLKGLKVSKIKVIAFARDFSKSKADYSKSQNSVKSAVTVVDINVMDNSAIEAYINERIKIHQSESILFKAGKDITPCSMRERWESPMSFALMKKNQKRALRVIEIHNDSDIETFNNLLFEKKAIDPTVYMETRLGVRRRCNEYCPVSLECPDYIKSFS